MVGESEMEVENVPKGCTRTEFVAGKSVMKMNNVKKELVLYKMTETDNFFE